MTDYFGSKTGLPEYVAAQLGIASPPSGVWTPTLTNGMNITGSTAYEGQYLRTGNTIHCTIFIDVDPTAGGQCQIGMSLPIASNLGSAINLVGAGVGDGGGSAACEPIMIYADAANDRAILDWFAVNIANHKVTLTFSYKVI
jgi:hypothetical protein